jgi:hypothetical protein
MNQQERAAMQAALDAYEADDGFAQHHAAELLRAALAQPEQEPVAWGISASVRQRGAIPETS